MMKLFAPDKMRNVVLAGQAGCGKTTLADGMLYSAGMVNRFGKVADGTSHFDTEPEEIARKSSVFSTTGYAEWKGYRITVIDTPGFPDLLGSIPGPLAVVEGVVLVISAVDGLAGQTKRTWDMAKRNGLAGLVFVNRMDNDRAEFAAHLGTMKQRFGIPVVPLQIPMGASESFSGAIDVLSGKAMNADETGKEQQTEIPDEYTYEYEIAREALAEAAAEGDDELLEKYLDGQGLTDQEILSGLRSAIADGKVMPVLCGAAEKGIGTSGLLDSILKFFPAPCEFPPLVARKPNSDEELTVERSPEGPLTALAFKTVADPYVGRLTYFRVFSGTLKSDSEFHSSNRGQKERIGQLYLMQGKENSPVASVTAGEIAAVAKLEHTNTGHTMCGEGSSAVLPELVYPRPSVWLAVHPKTRADEDKMGISLRRLVEEDPSLQFYRDQGTGETLLAGLGDSHLSLAIERAKRKFGVEVDTTLPKVPYKETVRGKADAEGKHKKQTGGAGQFAVAVVEVSGLPRGSGFEFENNIVGAAISTKYVPSVEKGVRDRMVRGIIAGYPMTDFKVRLHDGKEHPVDSNDISFQMAGRLALEAAVPLAQPYLLEPIMDVDITVPEENIGDVIGDLNSRRGRVLGTEQVGETQVVRAQVPLAELYRYGADLRSMTRGEGSFAMEFAHYEEVPSHVAEPIIAQAKKDKEQN